MSRPFIILNFVVRRKVQSMEPFTVSMLLMCLSWRFVDSITVRVYKKRRDGVTARQLLLRSSVISGTLENNLTMSMSFHSYSFFISSLLFSVVLSIFLHFLFSFLTAFSFSRCFSFLKRSVSILSVHSTSNFRFYPPLFPISSFSCCLLPLLTSINFAATFLLYTFIFFSSAHFHFS